MTQHHRVAPGLCVVGLIVAIWHWGTVPVQTGHFGDDQEYLTMATSFVRHGSPEHQAGDSAATLERLPRRWQRTLTKKFRPGGAPAYYYESRDGQWYGYHFFTYPAVVAPVLAVLEGRPDAFRSHQYTNLIALSVAFLALLQLRNSPRLFWSITPLAFFTPVLWFTTYASTETFVFSLGIIALACWLRGRPLLAILGNSIAATQYQPLSLLSLFLLAQWAWTDRHELRRRPLRLGLGLVSAGIVFVPGVFYYLNYGTPNLIAREGLASTRFMTVSKVLDLFLDLNGGMLAFTPGLLFLLLLAAGSALVRLVRERDGWSFALFGCVMAVMLASTVQRNWNHPTFGVSRYIVYSIAPVLLFLGAELQKRALRARVLAALVGVALGLALLVHRVYGFIPYRGEDAAHHTPLAAWVMERWPALYAPHPEVFCERTVGRCWANTETGVPLPDPLPAIWRDSKGRARKILTVCDEARLLGAASWSDAERAEIRAAMAGCAGDEPFYVNLSSR